MPPGPHIVLSMWPLWATLLHVKERTVSCVSIGHRVSPSFPSDWVGRTLSAGFTPLEMPFPDACRITLASLSKCCSPEQLQKRLQAHPTAPSRTNHAPFNTVSSPELLCPFCLKSPDRSGSTSPSGTSSCGTSPCMWPSHTPGRVVTPAITLTAP